VSTEAQKWETLRVGLVACAIIFAGAALAVLLTGCSGFKGGKRPYAELGVRSPARHNVAPKAGLGYEWKGGAQVEAGYEPYLRVEDPSTRGFPQEIGRFYLRSKIPLGDFK